MRTQLTELELGISGALNITERMEMLGVAPWDTMWYTLK